MIGYDQILHCEIKFDDEENCISTGLDGTYYKLYSEAQPQEQRTYILSKFDGIDSETKEILEEKWQLSQSSGDAEELISFILQNCLVKANKTWASTSYWPFCKIVNVELQSSYINLFYQSYATNSEVVCEVYQIQFDTNGKVKNTFVYNIEGSSGGQSESYVDRTWANELGVDFQNYGGESSTRLTVLLTNSNYDTFEIYIIDYGGIQMSNASGFTTYAHSGRFNAGLTFYNNGNSIDINSDGDTYYVYGWYYN